MSEISFKAKIRKDSGPVYVVTIPKSYIDNQLANEGTEYKFIIEELE